MRVFGAKSPDLFALLASGLFGCEPAGSNRIFGTNLLYGSVDNALFFRIVILLTMG